MRRLAIVMATALLAGTAAVGAVIAWLTLRDPLGALPRDPAAAVSVVEERRESQAGRVLLHVRLRGPSVGDVRFVASLPEPFPDGPVPVVLVLGGLEGGTRSMRRLTEAIGDPGRNAFVAYDWPLPAKAPGAIEIATRLPALRRSVLSVPGQVDAMLGWASRQRWADPGRISLLGFSLGAFVVPAAQRVVEARGGAVRWTIVGYGGAPIGAVIAGHPGMRPRWAAPLLGAAADVLLRPVEPGEHLPHVRGRFLVLRAGRDRLIASAAADRLVELTPQPRTVIVIRGDHMGLGPDKKKLLQEVIAISRAWMIEQGAIAPAGALDAGARPGARTGSSGRAPP